MFFKGKMNSEKMNKVLGKNIKFLRESKQITQVELARALGLKHRQTISLIEQGEQSLTPYQLYSIGKIFDVRLEQIWFQPIWK